MNQKKAGVLLSYLSEAVKVLTGLLYTPVMLRLLGQSEYGLYQLVNSVVSYLGLLSLGFGSSYMRFYARAKAEEGEEEVARLNGMFMLIFCSISLVCLLCGGVMVANIRGIFSTGLTESEYPTARVLMVLMIFNLALTFPNSVFNCYVTSQERFFFQKCLILLQNLFHPFLTLPLLLMGYGSVGMVATTTFLTVAVLLSNMFYCFRRLRIRFSFRKLRFSLLKEMWVFTFFIFLNQIIDQINWSVDKFLLGRMTGTQAVAIYGVGGQINAMYLQFSTSISNVFVPQVNRIVAETDDNRALSGLFTRIGRVQFIVMGLILSGFCLFGQSFVKLWAGREYGESYVVTLFLIVPVTVPLIQNIGIEIQRAKNMHRARSVVYFLIAVGNIFLSIPLIRRFGPAGAAAGTAAALVVGNILFMNWYYHRRIGLDIPFFWKNIASLLPAMLPPVCLGAAMTVFVPEGGFPRLAVMIALYTVLYALSMYRFGMNSGERAMAAGLLRRRR